MSRKYIINNTVSNPKIVSVDTKTVKRGRKTTSFVTTKFTNNSVDQKTLTTEFKTEKTFFQRLKGFNIIFITLLVFMLFPFFNDDVLINYDPDDYNYSVENGFLLDENEKLAIPDYVSIGVPALESFTGSLDILDGIGDVALTAFGYVSRIFGADEKLDVNTPPTYDYVSIGNWVNGHPGNALNLNYYYYRLESQFIMPAFILYNPLTETYTYGELFFTTLFFQRELTDDDMLEYKNLTSDFTTYI